MSLVLKKLLPVLLAADIAGCGSEDDATWDWFQRDEEEPEEAPAQKAKPPKAKASAKKPSRTIEEDEPAGNPPAPKKPAKKAKLAPKKAGKKK